MRFLRLAISLAARGVGSMLLTLCALGATTRVAHGQPTPSAGAAAAETALRTLFDHLENMRWDSAAALVHPAVLTGFKTTRLEDARARERASSDTSPPQSDMPPEVAAWFTAQRKKHAALLGTDTEPALARELARVRTIAELEALSPEQAYARWLEARDPRASFRRLAALSHQPIPPDFREDQLPRDRRTIVGSVMEDDSTVHVVYRTSPFPSVVAGDERSGWNNALTTMRRTPRGWRLWSTKDDSQVLFSSGGWATVTVNVGSREKELAEAAKTVITWPANGTPVRGKAFVSGYVRNDKPPRALVVEVTKPNGSVVKVEVPQAVFGALAALLMNWPQR